MMQTILGIFVNRSDVEGAISQLSQRGFNPKDISIVMKDDAVRIEPEQPAATSSPSGSGVAGGAATGAVVGGLAGLLAAIAIPGFGAFLIGGPLAVALGLSGIAAATASGAVTGAVAGGIIGGLMSLGLSHEEATHYEEKVREGAILLAVSADEQEAYIVRDIFDTYHVTDVRTISQTDTHTEEEPVRRSVHFGK